MKSKTVLLLSLVMGIITTALFFQYMNQAVKKETVAATPMTDVIVAKETINKNKKITAEMLEVVQVPKESVLAKSINSISEAEGKLAEAKIEKGEPILAHRLISQIEEEVYVSRKVRDGFRAVSVSANLPQTVSNLIEVEDFVDVIVSKEDQQAKEKPVFKSIVLLEKARVLAVGKKLVLAEDVKDGENTEEQVEEYTTVTLELNPNDALKLVNAYKEGQLHFTLHTRPVMNDDGTPLETEKES
ncbi:Flp pilus assembly protein CpaB [Bacillus sp. FJAT-27225]|uniref:Flp pilus assembly protein CpaB n=1 Tax=Bacillus sp. FJAT-27225 TaxID=1743144 RepID=UPI00080C3328|nr:Flp pilus assembly protein CpaB [Bacillus sp. FJAT-27225]OCA84307.1 Flp pilus assembly protein CpaB [Bacillus sp. FJAT-27225]